MWEISDLGVDDSSPSVEFDEVEEPPARTEKCIVFDDGDASEMAGELVTALKDKGLNIGAYK